jgi:hypothetical protein
MLLFFPSLTHCSPSSWWKKNPEAIIAVLWIRIESDLYHFAIARSGMADPDRGSIPRTG